MLAMETPRALEAVMPKRFRFSRSRFVLIRSRAARAPRTCCGIEGDAFAGLAISQLLLKFLHYGAAEPLGTKTGRPHASCIRSGPRDARRLRLKPPGPPNKLCGHGFERRAASRRDPVERVAGA